MTLERRSPLGRGKPLAQGKPLGRASAPIARSTLRPGGRLRPRSPRKRERYEAIAAASAEALARDRYRCRGLGVIPGHDRCWGPIDPQHVIPKGVRPDLAADPANIIALCRAAHDWVGAHPDEAEALGLHGRAWDEPPADPTPRT